MRMYAKMTLQDYFPADLTLLGLRNRYSVVGKDSFYVNSNCVVAKDKTLTKGKQYLIFDITTKTNIKMNEIVLIDLFFYEGNIHVISEDIHTKKVSNLSFPLECPENDCTKYLVDIDYFMNRMDAQAINQYCGNCIDKKKKQEVETKANSNKVDLLEFDF